MERQGTESDLARRQDTELAQLAEENGLLRRELAELRGYVDAQLAGREMWHVATNVEGIEYKVDAIGHGREAKCKGATPAAAAMQYVSGTRSCKWMTPGVLLNVADPSALRDAGSVYEVLRVGVFPACVVRLAYVPDNLPALPGDLPRQRAVLPKEVVAGLRIRHRFGGALVVLRTNEGWAQVQAEGGEYWIDIERLCDEAEPS